MYGLVLTAMFLVYSLANAESLLDVDPAIRIQRNLLQEEDLVKDTKPSTEKVVEKEEGPIEISKGPTRFYFENGKLPKLLLEVKEGIILTVLKSGEVWDTFLLDKEATGGITGSKINPDSDIFQVDIDWKKQSFTGAKDPSKKIDGLQIEMKFNLKKNNFHLIELKIVNLAVKGKSERVELNTWTKHGYEVVAPIGLSFGCASPGMFGPRRNQTDAPFTAGLTFPDMQLQVYKVHRGKFGPFWECGNMISIGLWVGILVSLMFAIICAYGFTMLSNINTMDRFDDPKGKSIYVPYTD